jgi:hypothetical protein
LKNIWQELYLKDLTPLVGGLGLGLKLRKGVYGLAQFSERITFRFFTNGGLPITN